MLGPKVLIIGIQPTELAARFAIEISKVGCRIAAVYPVGHFLQKTAVVEQKYILSPLAPLECIENAIQGWLPQFLICGDDLAVRALHLIYQRACSDLSRKRVGIADVIEASLGSHLYFSSTEKSALMQYAPTIGIRCPATKMIADTTDLRNTLKQIQYPIVFKLDGTSAGTGVRVARDEQQAWVAYFELKKQSQRWFTPPLGFGWIGLTGLKRLAIQEFVDGVSANRAIFCWKGEVVVGVSAEVIESSYETGPSTVVRIIDHPQLATVTDRLAESLQLSGFCGFDFIIDSSGEALLIEINSRITPTAHLFTDEDLLAAMAAKLTAAVVRPRTKVTKSVIALFPHEWMRDPDSEYLRLAYHDVPWNDPAFINACFEMRRGKKNMQRLKELLVQARSCAPFRSADAKQRARVRTH